MHRPFPAPRSHPRRRPRAAVRWRALALSVAFLLALAAPAAARPQGEPAHIWSISRVRHGTGAQTVMSGSQLGGALQKQADLGLAGFSFPESIINSRAFGKVTASADGRHYDVLAQAPGFNPFEPRSPEGGITHLEQLQAYEKRADDASLTITIDSAILETIDDNHRLGPTECATETRCRPIHAIVRFHARAYAESTDGDFYDVGGAAFITGHQGHWGFDAVSSSDSQLPLWNFDRFRWVADPTESHGRDPGADQVGVLQRPRRLKVPLGSVREGELFAVDVTLDAEAVDERGRESAAEAAISDPQESGPALLTTRGLTPRGRPRFNAPRAKAPRAARCSRRSRGSGVVQLNEPEVDAREGSGPPIVLVTRTGGKRGAASVEISTRGGSAQSGADFTRTSTRVRFADGDDSPRLVDIPIREDAAEEPDEALTVHLNHARCAGLGARRSATVTIRDDDAPPAQPPPPAPTPVPTPEPTPAPAPPGLDPTFGGDGRVSTSVGGDGQGEAVVIQPDGTIVTAGRAGQDFALTRHDAAGHLLGVTTTDLGTQDDEAFGAASLPDGGTVAVGRTLTTPVDYDVALVRYRPDGTPDPAFGVGGIVKTDVFGSGDVGEDVAVQPDGKIVVCGFATRNGTTLPDGDFLLARYRPDGTPDPTFGDHGIVTTDIGDLADAARAIAIRPNGEIVVAGTSGEDVALARYTSDGTIEGAPTVTDFGSDDVADGVALEPDGHIVIAGFTLGPGVNRDFLLARYTAAGAFEQKVTTDVGGGDDFGKDLVVDSAGRIIVVGRAISPTILDLALVRYRPDLAPDPTFDGDGVMTVDFHGRGDVGEDVALDASGRIVAAGGTGSATGADFALTRVNP